MPHSTAIAAFQSIHTLSAGLLLARLYSILVTIELISKDYIKATTGRWANGHDVCSMLVTIDGTLTASSAQLKAKLEILLCTDRSGQEATVTASKYPDLRYLRHVSDAPAWTNSSTDPMIQAAFNDARLCLQQLKTLGIAP